MLTAEEMREMRRQKDPNCKICMRSRCVPSCLCLSAIVTFLLLWAFRLAASITVFYCTADGQGKGNKAGLKQGTAGSKRHAASIAGDTSGPTSKKARPEGSPAPADAKGHPATASTAPALTESDGATAMDTDASPGVQPAAATPSGMIVFRQS